MGVISSTSHVQHALLLGPSRVGYPGTAHVEERERRHEMEGGIEGGERYYLSLSCSTLQHSSSDEFSARTTPLDFTDRVWCRALQEGYYIFREMDPAAVDGEEEGKSRPLKGPNQWPSEELLPGWVE